MSSGKMSVKEKTKLAETLAGLSPEDLSKALKIVARNNPSFEATADEVDLDMDAQSESTLRKLVNFVKEVEEKDGSTTTTV